MKLGVIAGDCTGASGLALMARQTSAARLHSTRFNKSSTGSMSTGIEDEHE